MRSLPSTIARYAAAVCVLLVWTFPLLWTVLTSFKTANEVFTYPPHFFFHPTLENYRQALFGYSSIVPNLGVSAVIATSSTILTMLISIPAAYALARRRFRGKQAVGLYVLSTQMLPPIGLIIPYFLIFNRIGWSDTYQGLIAIYLTFAIPFAIWLMVSFFEDVPLEMEEAAYLDRCSRFRTLWHVILPQVRGGIVVTLLFVFMSSWNEFLFAIVIGGSHIRTVTAAMYNFISVEQTLWGPLTAAACITMLPVVIIGLFAQRHIISGLSLGAVKGGRTR
jgi:multiple sugar transport system permease protein